MRQGGIGFGGQEGEKGLKLTYLLCRSTCFSGMLGCKVPKDYLFKLRADRKEWIGRKAL